MLVEQLIMEAAKRSAPLTPTWSASQLQVPRTEPLRMGLARAAVQVFLPQWCQLQGSQKTHVFKRRICRSHQTPASLTTWVLSPASAVRQACGTMFLVLGSAWSSKDVGQPMLNILTAVRLPACPRSAHEGLSLHLCASWVLHSAHAADLTHAVQFHGDHVTIHSQRPAQAPCLPRSGMFRASIWNSFELESQEYWLQGLCWYAQAFTAQQDESLRLEAFAAWRTLALVVFRSGELARRTVLLLQPVKHAFQHDSKPPLLEVRDAQLPRHAASVIPIAPTTCGQHYELVLPEQQQCSHGFAAGCNFDVGPSPALRREDAVSGASTDAARQPRGHGDDAAGQLRVSRRDAGRHPRGAEPDQRAGVDETAAGCAAGAHGAALRGGLQCQGAMAPAHEPGKSPQQDCCIFAASMGLWYPCVAAKP